MATGIAGHSVSGAGAALAYLEQELSISRRHSVWLTSTVSQAFGIENQWEYYRDIFLGSKISEYPTRAVNIF